jgi:hypothetical protein
VLLSFYQVYGSTSNNPQTHHQTLYAHPVFSDFSQKIIILCADQKTDQTFFPKKQRTPNETFFLGDFGDGSTIYTSPSVQSTQKSIKLGFLLFREK